MSGMWAIVLMIPCCNHHHSTCYMPSERRGRGRRVAHLQFANPAQRELRRGLPTRTIRGRWFAIYAVYDADEPFVDSWLAMSAGEARFETADQKECRRCIYIWIVYAQVICHYVPRKRRLVGRARLRVANADCMQNGTRLRQESWPGGMR